MTFNIFLAAFWQQRPVLFALLLISIFLSFFLNLHAVPLFDLDEGAFSEATREMFERGDFISTYLNGQPRYDKPILIYWLQAASVAVFGVNEFAFRLPSAIMAGIWVMVIFFWVSRFTNVTTGFFAALITATTLEVTVIGRAATADALLNCIITATMLTLFGYYRERRKTWLYLAFALMGLGFLTKGPVAVVIPAVVSGLFCLLRGQWRFWLQSVFNVRGMVLFLVIALPWYVVQTIKEGWPFIEGFFLRHNVERFSEPMHGNSGALFYYVPVVLVAVIPYTAVLLAALTRVRSLWRDDLFLFCMLWFGFVLLVFSFSGTKLPHYILYGLPGLFILMADRIQSLKSHGAALSVPLVFFVCLLFLPELLGLALKTVDDDFLRARLAGYEDYVGWGYRLFFLAAIALCVAAIVRRPLPVGPSLGVAGAASVVSMGLFVVPLVAQLLQQPLKEAGELVRGKPWTVVMWGMNTPSFSVYARRVVEKRRPEAGEVVLTKTTRLERLGAHEVLYAKHGIVLARVASP